MTEILLAILGGLVLFLYAVSSLSEVIKEALGDRAREWILKFTSNTFTAVLTGTIITILLDSSSAVIIITIVFVNAGFLRLRQAMGIVLGANIGTTISSQIIAMDIGKYSPILLLAGFALLLISRSPRLQNGAKAILYFGVLFFGLFTMENAVEPLRDEPAFNKWLMLTEQPLQGSLIGALLTLVIQSSSATVGMGIILVKKGLLSLAGGVSLMLGAELGTCSDTLLATIKGSRQAIKTGVFHLIFNILSILLGLAFFYPFVSFVLSLGPAEHPERMMANAHMLFNIGGVLVFVWFIPGFERMLNFLLPDKSTSNLEQV